MYYKYHLLGVLLSPFEWDMLLFYGIMELKKDKNGDVSNNDDKQRARPKPNFIPPNENIMVNIEYI